MLQLKPLRLFRADLNVGDGHEVVFVYGGRPSQVSSSGGPQPATPEAAEDVRGATLFWSYTTTFLLSPKNKNCLPVLHCRSTMTNRFSRFPPCYHVAGKVFGSP